MCRNSVGPVSDASYEVVRASFRDMSAAYVQEMGSHDWVLSELGAGADDHDMFSFAFPRGGIEVTNFSSLLLAQASVGYAHNML